MQDGESCHRGGRWLLPTREEDARAYQNRSCYQGEEGRQVGQGQARNSQKSYAKEGIDERLRHCLKKKVSTLINLIVTAR